MVTITGLQNLKGFNYEPSKIKESRMQTSIYIKSLLFSILLLFQSTVTIKAQNTTFLITNETGNPIQNANVCIEYNSGNDSLSTYATSDSLGYVMIPNLHGIMSFFVSAVGYEELHSIIDVDTLKHLTVKSKINSLEEVTVIGKKALVSSNGKSIKLSVENTILSRLASFNELIKHIPFTTTKGENVEIFGRGVPEYRINGHHASSDEIQNLSPSNIKSINVILFPGAEYETSKNAVIDVTLRDYDLGCNGLAYASLHYLEGKMSENLRSAITYRKKEQDVFFTLNFRDTRNKNEQEQAISQVAGEPKRLAELRESQRNWFGVDGTLGVNYASNKFDYGIKADFTVSPFIDDYSVISMDFNEMNTSSVIKSQSTEISKIKAANSGINGYFSFRPTEKFSVGIEDYVNVNINQKEQNVTENIIDCNKNDIKHSSNYNYFSNSFKVKLNHNISNLCLEYGLENTYNKYKLQSVYNSLIEVPSSELFREESHTSAFLQCSYKLPFLDISTGARFEHSNIVTKPNTERLNYKFDNFFPTINITSRVGECSLTFNYDYYKEWPAYSLMNNSVEYVSCFEYSRGNSLLYPTRVHNLGLLGSYKGVNLMLSYVYKRDAVIRTYEKYQNQDIILKSFNNVDNLSGLIVSINWNKRISFWYLYTTATLSKPFFEYNNVFFNKPTFSISLNNSFALSKSISLMLNADFCTDGNEEMWYVNKTGKIEAGMFYTCCKEKLNIGIYCTDIFRTAKEGLIMNTPLIHLEKRITKNTNGVCLSFSYNFNYKSERYKQGEVGVREKNRILSL